MRRQVLYSLILTVAVSAFAKAQVQPDSTWHTLTSSSGEFSVTVPADYIVYKAKHWNEIRVSGSGNGAFFDTTFRRTGDADEWIESVRKAASEKTENREFTVGEAQVHTRKQRSEKAFGFSVYVSTRKGYYSVTTTSADSDNTAVAAVLASIRLNGLQLLRDLESQSPTAAASIKVSSLKTSEFFKTAVRRSQTDRIDIVEGDADDPPRDRDKFYSRRLLILDKAPARYTEEARSNNISGTVRLRVLFKANGNIGRITVLKGLPFGLTMQAIKTAAGIKFLPAEVLGIPADAEATLEYSFSIF